MAKIKFTIITLFPEALRPYLESSMLYKAQDRGILMVNYANLRDFGLGPHKSVDDTPYGGGDGMLLRCEPVFAAIESVKADDPTAEVILPTPVGQVWNQALVRQFAGVASEGAKNANGLEEAEGSADPERSISEKTEEQPILENSKQPHSEEPPRHFIILCPHYEGYDERILTLVDHRISLGHYVLTGGELAALIIIDSVTRLLPGVLGGENSAAIESFADAECQSLEYPQYTKPAEFRGMAVPEVLLSGNHGEIAKWRAAESGRAK